MEVRDEQAKDNVLKALADDYSRKILLSTIASAKSAVDLSREHNIPISSTYRRVHDLTEVGLLSVERAVVTEEGKRFDLYRSTVKSVSVRFELGTTRVDLLPNEDMVAKFARLWSSVKGR